MPRRKTPRYTYKGQQFDSESAMLLHLLDEYRCIEGFAARYLGAWRAVSEDPGIAGGLRTVCGREQLHADLLEARLRELGGTPRCEVPPERLADLEYYSTTDHSDAEKLGKIATRLQDPDKVLQFLTEAIAQIDTDRETRELLATILDDERATIAWFRHTWEAQKS
jgi:bacterioferritin (cytochrome b1)